jgi:hypothetical protein
MFYKQLPEGQNPYLYIYLLAKYLCFAMAINLDLNIDIIDRNI